MTQKPARYCQNCGKPLNAQARFCGNCGQAIPQQQSAPAAAPPPPAYQAPAPQPTVSENVIAVTTHGTRKSGFLGARSITYYLVLTDQRVIFATQTAKILKESAQEAREAAKQGGKGFFGQWGASLVSGRGDRYLGFSPQAILDEDPGNFYLLNNQVRSIRLKEHIDTEEGTSEVTMIMDTSGDKIEITFPASNKKQIRQILQQTLGNRVR